MGTPSSAAARVLAPATGLAIAGLALLGSPAAASVDITPGTAVQGGEAGVTFLVRNDRPGTHTTKVEVVLPPATPIAEVYPMTVPDWAPRITYRTVDQSLRGIHGSGLTTATSTVTWERADDAPPPPAVESLRLEMGPLPSVDRFVFTVVQTYADGAVQRWQGASPARAGQPAGPGTVLTLTPAAGAAPGASDGHGAQNPGHGRHQGQGATAPALPATATASTASSSFSPWSMAVGAVGALLVAVGAMLWRRSTGADPRAAVTNDEEPPAQQQEEEQEQQLATSPSGAPTSR